MHRFFIAPEAISGGKVTLGGEQARQMFRVLRFRPGERITVLDNSGQEYMVELTAVSATLVQGQIISTLAAATEPGLHVTLYQALLKADKFAWVLQKGTELGIAAFAPVWTERSIVPLQAAQDKTGRWAAIIREAAEQSHRGRLPTLAEPVSLRDALRQQAGPVLIPWEGEQTRGLRATLGELGAVARLGLVIGPEGGFSASEVALAAACGAIPVSLGPRILRAETAGLVAAASILYHYGHLGG